MVRHCRLGTPTPSKPPAEPSSPLLREQVGNLLSTFFLEKSAMVANWLLRLSRFFSKRTKKATSSRSSSSSGPGGLHRICANNCCYLARRQFAVKPMISAFVQRQCFLAVFTRHLWSTLAAPFPPKAEAKGALNLNCPFYLCLQLSIRIFLATWLPRRAVECSFL